MEKTYKMDTNNLITLCHIVDDFKEFEKKLKPAITNKYNRNFIFQLWDVSQGKFKIGAIKAKKFYEQNKKVIDTINKYSNVPTFINLNYGYYGDELNDNSITVFYNYLLENKDKLDKILAVLNKIKELGFGDINFNPELDFSQLYYSIYNRINNNWEFIYLDNLVARPHYNYNNNKVIYKTTDSSYKIKLKVFLGKIKEYDKEITLNDLTFDYNRLPNSLSIEDTFDKISNLNSENTVVKNSVDLNVSIDDLMIMHNIINRKLNSLDDVDKKQELIKLLTDIKDTAVKMHEIVVEYDNDIISNNEDITEELLKEEKEQYKRRSLEYY